MLTRRSGPRFGRFRRGPVGTAATSGRAAISPISPKGGVRPPDWGGVKPPRPGDVGTVTSIYDAEGLTHGRVVKHVKINFPRA